MAICHRHHFDITFLLDCDIETVYLLELGADNVILFNLTILSWGSPLLSLVLAEEEFLSSILLVTIFSLARLLKKGPYFSSLK